MGVHGTNLTNWVDALICFSVIFIGRGAPLGERLTGLAPVWWTVEGLGKIGGAAPSCLLFYFHSFVRPPAELFFRPDGAITRNLFQTVEFRYCT
jgi:hypothetical protein